MEEYEMLGNKIAELRKEKGMTQEALAKELGVSNQAVSKWESDQSCPDVLLLPQISDLFGITLDELFGRNYTKTETEKNISELPWGEDGVLRAVLYIGHTLVKAQECIEQKKIEFRYYGEALNIDSELSVTCNDVKGNVTAAGNVACGDIQKDAEAGGNLTCDTIGGNARAGANIICNKIHGISE